LAFSSARANEAPSATTDICLPERVYISEFRNSGDLAVPDAVRERCRLRAGESKQIKRKAFNSAQSSIEMRSMRERESERRKRAVGVVCECL
jgi:hypothetical protein